MKWLHVIRSMDPRQGGPVAGVHALAKTAYDLGHEVDVVCLDTAPNGDPSAGTGGGEVVFLGPSRGVYGLNARIHSWLLEHATKYDAVVVDGMWQFHGLAVWRAARRAKFSYYLFPHGMLDPWFRERYPFKHLKKLVYWILAERFVFAGAASVLYTAEEERGRSLQSFPFTSPRQSNVVGYAVGRPPSNTNECITDFLSAHPVLKNKKLILFLGRVHEKKGCDLLIQAFANSGLVTTHVLAIAGPVESEMKARLDSIARRHGVQESVHWLGMLSGNMKWGCLASADLFCLPSHQENFGVAVVESLAVGVPVIVSNRVNIWSEIHLDDAGLICEDNANSLTKSLEAWRSLSNERKAQMRESALRCYEQRFGAQTVVRKLVRVFGKESECPDRRAA